MKILLLGLTQSGKTTTSQILASHLNFQIYSMSKMFRETYIESDFVSLTEHSKNLLVNNPNINIEYIQNYFQSNISNIDKTIFEGFRNPEEFLKFLDSETIVIVLKPLFKSYKDDFEKYGVLACENIALWKKETNDLKDIFILDYASFNELNVKLLQLIEELK